MRNCTIGAPVESCTATSPPAPPNNRFAAVQLLTGQVLYFCVEPKTRVKEVYTQTCLHLSGKGMVDTEFFGLATLSDGEYLFADPEYKLSKYAPKNWRSSSTHGLDGNGKPLLVFHFRVQFYVESPLLLRDDTSRHFYYLQLRYNVQVRGLLHSSSSEESLYLLAGLALQADVGDYTDTTTQTATSPTDAASNSNHSNGGNKPYFRPQDYFPQQMVNNGNESRLVQMALGVHRANHGLSKAEAEMQYIREASSADTSPLTHNSHLYRLKHERLKKLKKQDAGPGTVLLSICMRGIRLYEENSTKALTGTFLWNDIGKFAFDKKKFEIRALNCQKLTYYTSCDEKSKHHFALCKETHQFSMTIQPRLAEIRRKEADEVRRYREWGGNRLLSASVDYSSHRGDQRISVISSTSSNTTSGIVSDRVHSLDESEDDLDMEVMINSPPAASVESLALAHLHDGRVARGTASPSPLSLSRPHACPPPPPSQTDMSSTAGQQQELGSVNAGTGGSPCTVMTGAKTAGVAVGGSTTPATTDGSQCSSSCSTVVVAGCPPETVTPRDERNGVNQRRGSTSSSLELELGFSHTAQNSVVSDSTSACLELDYSVQSAHTSSGVYTLRSSTLNMANTVACSSETSGIGVDESEGHRTRSGSLVSASGSFHGDGSDPSDAGRGTLLTAEELSDLIVGRSPKPRRGVYPSRATVSSTLDSDSDYVTLPPPPLPPPRSDSDPSSQHAGSRGCGSYVLVEQQQQPVPMDRSATLSYHEDSLLNSRKVMEEQILQQQIQFQHLASPYSPQLVLPKTTQPSYLGVPDHHILVNAAPPPGTLITNHHPVVAEDNPRYISTSKQQHILSAHLSAGSYPTMGHQHHGGTFVAQEPRKYPTAVIDPASRMKAQQSLIPIVGSNNYLDVRGSGAAFLQHYHQKFPPPLHPRQPPPPPPPPPLPARPSAPALATVYTSQVTRSQIEQFKQQLYSDVDYVIYPMQDPAISKQEYMDSKLALATGHHYSHHRPLLQQQPPPYLPPSTAVYHHQVAGAGKSRIIYRSTPNVAVATGHGYIPVPAPTHGGPPVKYASNQNLADYPGSAFSFVSTVGHHPSSTSPLYSGGASYSSSSTQSLRYDPVTLQLLSPVPNSFARTRSDDNILSCVYDKPPSAALERTRFRRPPPPLPPPYDLQSQYVCDEAMKKMTISPSSSLSLQKTVFPPSLPKPAKVIPEEPPRHHRQQRSPAATTTDTSTKGDAKSSADGLLDIRTLREKSRNLDLPLISALCNDRSLLKQTNAFVMPKHPGGGGPEGREWERDGGGREGTGTAGKKFLAMKNAESVAAGGGGGGGGGVAGEDGTPSTASNLSTTSKKNFLFSSFLSTTKSVGSVAIPSKYATATSISSSSSKLKYPVSGLSTNQIVNKQPVRKAAASRHTHPHSQQQQQPESGSGRTKVVGGNSQRPETGCKTLENTLVPQ